MTNPTSNALGMLVGEEINAICFVMDYVELHFNGPVLRSIADPEISLGEVRAAFPDDAARRLLCDLIGSRVDSVSVQDGVAIALSFSSGHELRIPLDPGNQAAGESAHFMTGKNNSVLVW